MVTITNDFHKITEILKNNQIVDKTFRIHYTENAFLNSRGIIFVRDIVKLHTNNILIISVYWIHVVPSFLVRFPSNLNQTCLIKTLFNPLLRKMGKRESRQLRIVYH
jgi:hypothetical protein